MCEPAEVCQEAIEAFERGDPDKAIEMLSKAISDSFQSDCSAHITIPLLLNRAFFYRKISANQRAICDLKYVFQNTKALPSHDDRGSLFLLQALYALNETLIEEGSIIDAAFCARDLKRVVQSLPDDDNAKILFNEQFERKPQRLSPRAHRKAPSRQAVPIGRNLSQQELIRIPTSELMGWRDSGKIEKFKIFKKSVHVDPRLDAAYALKDLRLRSFHFHCQVERIPENELYEMKVFCRGVSHELRMKNLSKNSKCLETNQILSPINDLKNLIEKFNKKRNTPIPQIPSFDPKTAFSSLRFVH